MEKMLGANHTIRRSFAQTTLPCLRAKSPKVMADGKTACYAPKCSNLCSNANVFSGKWRYAANKSRGIEREENTGEHPETAPTVSRIRYLSQCKMASYRQ